jgi:hypothetical protein
MRMLNRGAQARSATPFDPPARRRRLRTIGVVAATLALAALPAAAQVGHPPANSPYRDIRKGHSFTPVYGQFGGDGGSLGIGPHDGPAYGFRYDIRNGSTLQFGFAFSYAELQRLIVNPFVELANRVSGPVDQTVGLAEINLQFNLTGTKTWHRLAPFLGAGIGLTFPNTTPGDSSGYDFGHKIYLVPSAGVRLFVTDRLFLRGEVRSVFWKLKYPNSFTLEPRLEPGTPDHPNAVIINGDLSEWDASTWLLAGLGFSFAF